MARDEFSIENDKVFQEATTKLAQLRSDLAAAEAKLKGISESHAQSRRDQLDSEARDLLLGKQPQPQPQRDKDISAAIDSVDRLKIAVHLQDRAVTDARRDASGKLRPKVEAQYRGIISSMDDAMKALDVAVRREEDFREGLDQAGVCVTRVILPCPFRQYGPRSDMDQAVLRWRSEALEAGYLR